ncbi:MAG: adenosine kinase [candidate division Zixibacteria bacterium]|nr:adenosine kinase [candidate division Zixibacteria bacterium]
MSETTLGVVAVGNALVDVLAHATDDFIETHHAEHGMVKGAMTLIDSDRAVDLYMQMGPGLESSGGSSANTIAGYASFGGKGGFIGKVANDQLGRVFVHDIRSLLIEYDTPPLTGDIPTGRCLILVTPDAQRTMNTYLGASVELGPEDVNRGMVTSAQVTYLEGYLFDKDRAKKAFETAAQYAHEAGRKVALTLSDSFCVNRHRDDFRKLINSHIDILFANEDEIKALYEQSELPDALKAIDGDVEIAVVTRSEKGAVVLSAGEQAAVPAEPVAEVVDTTGAGDQFAAGFLYGLTEGMDLEKSAKLGAIAAAEVISHLGPRPETPLAELLEGVA